MKKLIFIIPLFFLIGCLTTSQVYLPHTSRVFHKKNCIALINAPNPIIYPSVQAALNTGGVTACSVCIKIKQYTPSSGYIGGYTQYPSYYSNQSTSNQNIWGNSFGSSVFNTPTLGSTSLSSGIISTTPTLSNQGVAENSSYYGEISEATGRPKTVYVNGYHRKDGTYVRSHYRSPPLNNMTQSLYKKYSNPPDSSDYNRDIPPIKKVPFNPSGFPVKGSGLLGDKYSNPPATGSGILGN